MTSREIAGLTDKEHKHVLRDCQNMFDQLNMPLDGYTQNWTHPQNGLTYIEYLLTKDLALCLVSGYSAILRMKIITRLNELENKNNPMAIAATMNSAQLSVLMVETQAKEKAIHQLALAQPAVAFVERYVQSTGNLGFRQVCKLLKIKENDFRAFLQDNKIMYRLGSEWMPYAPHIDAGRFYVTTGTSGTDHAYSTAKFTPKGVEWIAKLWGDK